MQSKSQPLFLLGAGFNADAKSEVDTSEGWGYPMVSELGNICFGIDTIPEGKSIEDLFQEALESNDDEPVKKLTYKLMEADYYITCKFLKDLEAQGSSGSYARFFQHFDKSHFLTFNYDSLPEILLASLERWYPHDGYGMNVEAGFKSRKKDLGNFHSTSLVLHLHGTLCVYASAYERERYSAYLKFLDKPTFVFDPDAIGNRFPKFERIPPKLGFKMPEKRFIAPIPNKAKLAQPQFADEIQVFVEATYAKALELIRNSNSPLVTIGYSFNPHDHSSFDPLLMNAREVIIISPDAKDIKCRLSQQYLKVCFKALPYRFAEWVSHDFDGL